jgi:hypothetical protein
MIDECDAEIERAVAGLNIDRPVQSTAAEGQAPQQAAE